MNWNLQREEILDGEQLARMLEENPARAAQAILIAARENIVDAQALLGQILLDGNGIEQDQVLALQWFAIDAQKGHSMARNMLGRCHEHGWGCEPDAAKAAGHYLIAAEHGLDWGLYNLGNLLSTGRGIQQDPRRALNCYRQAANMGHAKSMNLLGRYLEEGYCCQVDLPAAYEWYRRSAEAGDFRGQFSYAAVLADQGHLDQAVAWLKTALAGGNLNFLRVTRKTLLQASQSQLRALAIDYHQRAAELGDESDAVELRNFQADMQPPVSGD
ncbi:tetratricopeptide repeat protein [Pseudomonas sp. Pseusp122]|uniref:tetratricopeptide repeat protein n=1 Tax=unclassified Pseudomonas TaxID=196821 RepID=UPI0039A41B68